MKLTGRWIKVLLDDSGGTPRDISTDVVSVDVPIEYDEIDMTGFQDAVQSSAPGLPVMNVELQLNMNPLADTGGYTVVKSILGGSTGRTLTVQVGQGAVPTTGDPEFEGEFWLPKLNLSANPKGGIPLAVSLRPVSGVAPAWGTMA